MTMFKKVLALLLVVTLTATASVGLTLAYLQDQDEAVNTMTLGNVDIEQIEQERNENDLLVDFEQDKPLYPVVGDPADTTGDVYWDNNNVVDKIVSVENTGKSDAYVRTVFAFEKLAGMDDLVDKNINETDWDWDKNVAEIVIDGTTYSI